MHFSIIGIFNQLGTPGIICLVIAAAILLYHLRFRRIHVILFVLVMAAALYGAKEPTLDGLAFFLRWLSLLLLLVLGAAGAKLKPSPGILLFWGYSALGFLFLLRAVSLEWQLDKSLIMLTVTISLPFAFGALPYNSAKQSLFAIASASTIYSFLNFVPLLGALGEPGRFAGVMKGSPTLALSLGALVPFSLWGALNESRTIYRIFYSLGFALGSVTLFLTGQRTGTIAGLLAIVPLLLISLRRQKAVVTLLIIPLVFFIGFVVIQQASARKLSFLSDRYNYSAGVSSRDDIWRRGASMISEEPVMGRGFGASETVIMGGFHNGYLEAWYNTGLLGFMMYLSAQLYFFYRTICLYRRNKNRDHRLFLGLTMGYMIGFAGLNMFESYGAGASNLNNLMFLFFGALVSNKHLFSAQQFTSRRATAIGARYRSITSRFHVKTDSLGRASRFPQHRHHVRRASLQNKSFI